MFGCGVGAVTIGLFDLWAASVSLKIDLQMVAPFVKQSETILVGLFGAIFITAGVAIGRGRPWGRPLILGVVPVYFVININLVLMTVWMPMSYLGFHDGWKSDVLICAPLATIVPIFTLLCIPRRPNASGIGRIPMPLCSWAIGCVSFGFFRFAQAFLYIYWSNRPHLVEPEYLLFDQVVLASGLLSLCGVRFGWIASIVAVLGEAILSGAVVAVHTWLMLLEEASPAETYPFWRGQIRISGVSVAIIFAAALFGLYAWRFFRDHMDGSFSADAE